MWHPQIENRKERKRGRKKGDSGPVFSGHQEKVDRPESDPHRGDLGLAAWWMSGLRSGRMVAGLEFIKGGGLGTGRESWLSSQVSKVASGHFKGLARASKSVHRGQESHITNSSGRRNGGKREAQLLPPVAS